MNVPFSRKKEIEDLETKVSTLERQIAMKDKKNKELEEQVKNRTGVEWLDPEGVKAILTYRNTVGELDGSNRDPSVLKGVLNHHSLMNVEFYGYDDGSVLLCGAPYEIPVPGSASETAEETEQPTADKDKTESEQPQSETTLCKMVAYDILLPPTIRYGNLSQIADVLSPLHFKDLRYLLGIDENDDFFILPGEIYTYIDENGIERHQITLMSPESEKVVIIRNNSIEGQRLDLASCQAIAKSQDSTLTNKDLEELNDFQPKIMSMYFEEWYAPLEGFEFIFPGAKD